MAIYGPQLVSCSALPTESVIVRAGTDAYLIVAKAHQGEGFPRRELEIFSVASVIANETGPFFFNVYPLRVEVLQDNFYQVSAITLTGNRIRFYYNTPTISGGQETIYQRDMDVVTRESLTERTALSFNGIDPVIVDGRTGLAPNRLYIVYVDASGRLLTRKSLDLGAVWGTELVIDDTTPPTRLCDANVTDPLTVRENIQVLMKRD